VINLRTGQPGHGKSYGAIRCIRDALERGEWVVTNIPMTEDWAEIMARTNWARRLLPGRCAKTAASYRARLVHVDDLTQLRRYRLPPCGKCRGCRNGPGCQREGRGRAVLDEAHQWLNSRTWDADETGQAGTKAEAVRRRLDVVRFFATHRHRGWNIELVTQDEANLDRQVRALFETHTHMKNLRRFKVAGLLPIVPVNVFVAVTHWHDNDRTRLGVEAFMLNRKLARCYDTMGAGRHLEDDDDAILLGAPDGRTDGRPPGASPPDGRPPAGDAPAQDHDDRCWDDDCPGCTPLPPAERPAEPLTNDGAAEATTSTAPDGTHAVTARDGLRTG